MRYRGLKVQAASTFLIISSPQKRILIPTVHRWTEKEIKQFIDENEKEIKEAHYDTERENFSIC